MFKRMLAWFCITCCVAITHATEPEPSGLPAEAVAASKLSQVFREVADNASPGIVTVYALRGPRMTEPMRMREQAVHGFPSESMVHRHAASSRVDSPDDQGSGVVIDRNGIVLTCSHVVQDANAVFVRTADGQKFHAKKIICDPVSDLAIIQLTDATDLHEVELANPDDVDVGDWVISLASPYDMPRSVSAGIVSSTKRWVSSSPYPLIQNDACTNPGSSGGALLNLRGEVVGIIEGAMTTTGEFQGIGLATPIDIAKDVAEQLRTQGYVERNHFGFRTQPLSPEMAKRLDSSIEAGLYVKEISAGSPAARAGLHENDIITALNGSLLRNDSDLQSFGEKLGAKKTHRLSVIRNHEPIEVKLRGQEYPTPIAHRPIPESRCDRCFEFFDISLGLGVSQLTPMLAEELKLPESTRGVLITHVAFESDAYREGVAAGTVIARINDRPIRNLEDYQEASADVALHEPFLLLLQSDREKCLVLLDGQAKKAKVKQP